MNNPGIDLIIRIKNGYMSRKERVESPFSNFREDLLKKLLSLGYIKDFHIEGDTVKKIVIDLLYKDGDAAITDVKVYSKPGKRWYIKSKELKPVLGGLGVSIISTPQGILTNTEAKDKKTGGELLFDIW